MTVPAALRRGLCRRDDAGDAEPAPGDHEGGDGDGLQRGRGVIHYTIVATNDGNMTLAT